MPTIGMGLLNACIRTYKVLWPDAAACKSVDELSVRLHGCSTRLREWRSSAAQAGDDEALAWVLSWYETIELDTLDKMREGSA